LSRLDKLQSLLVFAAVAMGLLLGSWASVRDPALSLVTPFLMVLLFGVFFQVTPGHLGRAFRKIKLASASLVVNFVWTPLLAWILGALFLRSHPELWLGLIMLLVTPCTDWYLIFTAMARGDVAFSTTLLPANLALQLLLLPVYLVLLGGAVVDIDAWALAWSLVIVLAVPFAAAVVLRAGLRARAGEAGAERVRARLAHVPLVFLLLAIVAMFASQGETVLAQPEIFALLLAPLLVFFALNFLLAQILGRSLRFSCQETSSLTMTTLARNSPLALAVAATAFPDRPLVALALVVAPLIELPILALAAQLLLRLGERGPGCARQLPYPD
jgi:arsenite transporter